MDKLVLLTLPNRLKKSAYDPNDSSYSSGAVIISTATGAAGLVPSVIAQQQEETSLGEEENLADSIVSDVLDDQNIGVDQDNTTDQDAANLGVQDQDATQEEELAQDADNTNVDFDLLVGGQSPLTEPPPTRPDEPPTPPPDDNGEPLEVETP